MPSPYPPIRPRSTCHDRIEKDLPGCAERERTNYRYIRDVELEEDGKGVMTVYPLRWKEVTRLFTDDFGRTRRR